MTNWTSRRPRRPRSGTRSGRAGFRPRVESLEDRRLLQAGGLGDAVLRWNDVLLEANAADHSGPAPAHGGPTATARAMAVVHAAIFDAVNAIDRTYQPYLAVIDAPAFASIDAAVAVAAHHTLVVLYPDQQAAFDAALAADLAAVPDGPAEQAGIVVGQRAAAICLAARENDGSDNSAPYIEVNAPGRFHTFPGEPDPLTPNWGGVNPFGIRSPLSYPVPAPPALDSAEYAAAYNEVKELGRVDSTTRTAEQTEIGLFWGYDGSPGLGVPPRLYNQIARVIAAQQHNTEVQNARLFFLVNVALADAGIVSWHAKYVHDFWRPVRGIRQLDDQGNPMDDGNPLTDADPTWTPLGAPRSNDPGGQNFTPPFPAYTSGHATFGAAVFQTIANFYGTDHIAFTFVSDELNGVTTDQDGSVRPLRPRSFTSLRQAAEENGRSRIYLGIHWEFDNQLGQAQGRGVANEVFGNVAVPELSRTERYVNAVYRELFDRRTDFGGMKFWGDLLESGGAPDQMMAGLEGTAEFRASLVQQVYRGLLGREADAAGLAFWGDFLAAGGTEEQLRIAVTGSAEYFAMRGGGTNEGFLDAVYEDALGRDADASGLAFYLQELASGMSAGEVAAQIYVSVECRTLAVRNFYRDLLGRDADQGGLDAFVAALQAGARKEDVMAVMMASQEYIDRVTAR